MSFPFMELILFILTRMEMVCLMVMRLPILASLTPWIQPMLTLMMMATVSSI